MWLISLPWPGVVEPRVAERLEGIGRGGIDIEVRAGPSRLEVDGVDAEVGFPVHHLRVGDRDCDRAEARDLDLLRDRRIKLGLLPRLAAAEICGRNRCTSNWRSPRSRSDQRGQPPPDLRARQPSWSLLPPCKRFRPRHCGGALCDSSSPSPFRFGRRYPAPIQRSATGVTTHATPRRKSDPSSRHQRPARLQMHVARSSIVGTRHRSANPQSLDSAARTRNRSTVAEGYGVTVSAAPMPRRRRPP